MNRRHGKLCQHLCLGVFLLAVVVLTAGCTCPPRPEASTSFGGSTYHVDTRTPASESERSSSYGVGTPHVNTRVPMPEPEPAPVPPPAAMGGEDDEMAPEAMETGAEPDAEPPEAPDGNGRGRTMPGAMVPVRLQIGPRPVVLEASRVQRGDTLRVVIREERSGEIVHEQVFKWNQATVRLTATEEDEEATGLAGWDPEPGSYLVELWSGDRQVGEKVVTVGD